jgi:hypothetical protein
MVSHCLFATTWECRRLQDCKDRRGLEWNENIKKLEELVHFLQESTGACILFEFANDLILQITPWICSQIYWKYCIFQSSWQIQHNCFLLYRQWRSFSDWFRYSKLTYHTPMAYLVNGNGIFVRVAGVVAAVVSLQSHSTFKFQI